MNAILKGLYGHLTASLATVVPVSRGPGGAAGVAVFDDAPQETAYPFVQIGDLSAIADDLVVDEISRVTVPLMIHSRYHGQREVLALAALVRTALHDVLIPIDDGALSQCRVTRQAVDRDADGITRVATLIVDLTLEH